MFRSLLSLRPWERFDQKRTKQKKHIGDKTPRRILPVLVMKAADMKMVNKRVRGWTSGWSLDLILC